MRSLILSILLPLAACQGETRLLNPYATSTPGPHRAKDPVCGKTIETNTLKKKTIDEVTYYFCSDACMTRFKGDPGSFVMR